MKVNFKCFAKLSESYECSYSDYSHTELNDGSTVSDFLEFVGIAEEEVKTIFVNNKITDEHQILSEGDKIGLAPATGGM